MGSLQADAAQTVGAEAVRGKAAPALTTATVTMEDILRSGTHRPARQDSARVSDALMALLRLHNAFPSASAVMGVAALCTSLALCISLAFAFPHLPGALTLLDAATVEAHRARFETLTLIGSTCCMTSFLLMLVLLLGSFGLQREKSLVQAAGFLLCTLCFHGALLQGAQWIYATPTGRHVSFARLIAVIHVSPLMTFLNCKLHHHGRITPLTVGGMSLLYGLLYSLSHLAPPPYDGYVFCFAILTSFTSCCYQVRFTLALPHRRGHSPGAAVLLASQIAGMWFTHPLIVTFGRMGWLQSTSEFLVNVMLEIGGTMAHTATHMFAIPGDPGQSESSSALMSREMQHFVGATDLKVAADIGQQCSISLANDVEAPLEALEALVDTLHRSESSSAVNADVATMLQHCSRTLRRVRDAAAICQVSQHSARLSPKKCQLLPLCKRALDAAQREGSCGRVQFDDSLIVQPPLLVDPTQALRLFTALFAMMGGTSASTHETSSSQMDWGAVEPAALAHLSALLDVSHKTHMLVVLKVPPAALGQAPNSQVWTAARSDLSTVKAVVSAHGGVTDLHIDDAGGATFRLTLPVHSHHDPSGSQAKAKAPRPHKHSKRARYPESGTQMVSEETPQVPAASATGSTASGDTTVGWSPSGLDRTTVSVLGSDLLGVSGGTGAQPACAPPPQPPVLCGGARGVHGWRRSRVRAGPACSAPSWTSARMSSAPPATRRCCA